MFALRISPNHTPIKYRGSVKKISHFRPIYLRGHVFGMEVPDALDPKGKVEYIYIYMHPFW